MSDELRDDLDRALAEGLKSMAASSAAVDADEVLGGMRPRLRHARARRRAVQAAVVSAFAFTLAVASAAATGSKRAGQVSVVQPPSSAPRDAGGAGGRATPTTWSSSVVSPGLPGSSSTPSGERTGEVPGTQRPAPDPSPTTPATTVAGVVREFRSAGGRITVRWAGGRLGLVSQAAEPGYAFEVLEEHPDELDVRFRRDGNISKIEVRIEHGVPVAEVGDE
jgi:hypothetical protein